MYQALLADVTFHHALLKLDEEIAAEWHQRGCGRCGARVDVANFERKPRAVLGSGWPELGSIRFSFCCRAEGCRKRSTPPSVRFLGRRIYFGAVVLIASVLMGGVGSIGKLSRQLGPSRRTLMRWRRWWTRTFPRTARFREIVGRVSAVNSADLPGALLDRVSGSEPERVLRMLQILKPLSIL